MNNNLSFHKYKNLNPKKSIRRKRGSKRPKSKRSKLKVSKWDTLRSRLSNLTKNPTERNDFLNLIQNRNTSLYRRKKQNKLSQLKFNTKKEFFLDYNFDNVTILSNPEDSASNSVVFKLTSDTNQYILKITGLKKIKGNNSPPDTERKNYSIMNKLVFKNITPHVFTLANSSKKEILLDTVNPILRSKLKDIFSSNIKYIYPIITETSDNTRNLYTVSHFLKKIIEFLPFEKQKIIILILLFQIIYTLEVFNRVGLKHNDLHIKNIFIQVHNKNIIDSNYDEYFNKYIVDDYTYFIPNIGLSIRIFDFDRTCKHDNGIFPSYKSIKSTLMPNLEDLHINCDENKTFDTYKILAEFYFKLKNFELKKIIEDCFLDINILLNPRYEKNGVFYKDLISDGFRYYLMNLPIPETMMKSTLNICNELGDKIMTELPRKDINSIFETYSLANIK